VRGWLRAFAGNAEGIRTLFTALLGERDPLSGPIAPHASVLADAVEVIGAAAAAAPFTAVERSTARSHRRHVRSHFIQRGRLTPCAGRHRVQQSRWAPFCPWVHC
jgi:hypothetical protein